MKCYIYANKDGVKCAGNAIIIEDPKVIVKTNRPSNVTIELDKDGNIKASADGRNKNNMDKVIENILPLMALKQV